jgi:hypothetical protein
VKVTTNADDDAASHSGGYDINHSGGRDYQFRFFNVDRTAHSENVQESRRRNDRRRARNPMSRWC